MLYGREAVELNTYKLDIINNKKSKYLPVAHIVVHNIKVTISDSDKIIKYYIFYSLKLVFCYFMPCYACYIPRFLGSVSSRNSGDNCASKSSSASPSERITKSCSHALDLL